MVKTHTEHIPQPPTTHATPTKGLRSASGCTQWHTSALTGTVIAATRNPTARTNIGKLGSLSSLKYLSSRISDNEDWGGRQKAASRCKDRTGWVLEACCPSGVEGTLKASGSGQPPRILASHSEDADE